MQGERIHPVLESWDGAAEGDRDKQTDRQTDRELLFNQEIFLCLFQILLTVLGNWT